MIEKKSLFSKKVEGPFFADINLLSPAWTVKNIENNTNMNGVFCLNLVMHLGIK